MFCSTIVPEMRAVGVECLVEKLSLLQLMPAAEAESLVLFNSNGESVQYFSSLQACNC